MPRKDSESLKEKNLLETIVTKSAAYASYEIKATKEHICYIHSF